MVNKVSQSEADTFEIGFRLGKKLKKGDVVACFGQLGSGKTVITKGIAAALNLSNVHSPTFTLLNEYEGDLNLYHFDAYRITGHQWLDCGFDEYLFGDGICVIEWAENLQGILPDNTIKITISPCPQLGDDYRQITIEGVEL